MMQGGPERDVAIVGAGPIGLFGVFQCGMLGLRCHVADALDHPGGQLSALYPEKPIYDIPGFPTIDAGLLVERLVAQAEPFDPLFHLGARVESLARQGDATLSVCLSSGVTLNVRTVIIAAGAGAFAPNRPNLPGIAAYEGRSVLYSIGRRDFLKGKRVVIAGGGDSAVDWALLSADLGSSVTLVHRRDKFRAAPESLRQLGLKVEEGRIRLAVPFQLAGLDGEPNLGKLSHVIIRSLDGQTEAIPSDVLLPCFGLSAELGPIADWGLAVSRGSIDVDPTTCATSVPGVFAIGDVARYPGKLKLILTGFAEAAQAAHAARALLRPHEVNRFEHSTTKGLPSSRNGQSNGAASFRDIGHVEHLGSEIQ